MNLFASCRGLLAQLSRPFSYLTIKHELKWQMDWLIPGIVSITATTAVLLLWPSINIYGDSGIISRVLSFIQNLPGFYIAALAAIATFGRSDIDSTMPEPTPTIIENRMGRPSPIPLTRRRFLCMMFAFLTAECVTLIIISILVLSIGAEKTVFMEGDTLKVIAKVGFYIYAFFLSQMILATFWGLFYLGDRIHRVD